MTILLEDILTLIPTIICVGILVYFYISETIKINKIKKQHELEIKELNDTFKRIFNENI